MSSQKMASWGRLFPNLSLLWHACYDSLGQIFDRQVPVHAATLGWPQLMTGGWVIHIVHFENHWGFLFWFSLLLFISFFKLHFNKVSPSQWLQNLFECRPNWVLKSFKPQISRNKVLGILDTVEGLEEVDLFYSWVCHSWIWLCLI